MAIAAANARLYVRNPGSLVPRTGGLFTAANGPLDLPVHARFGGLEYETPACALPDGYQIECIADLNSKTFDNGISVIIGDPFVVYSSLGCGSVGLDDPRLRETLINRLKAGEQAIVENIFSTQAVGQAPGLANNAAVVTLAASSDIVEAFGTLEAALYALYGLPGVIHLPFLAAEYAKSAHLIEKEGLVWKTAAGTTVSIGNYTGNAPGGGAPAAGTQNIYITGQVTVWRTPDSDIFIRPLADTLNRTTNQVTALAEREYVVSFDCYVAATATTLALTTPAA